MSNDDLKLTDAEKRSYAEQVRWQAARWRQQGRAIDHYVEIALLRFLCECVEADRRRRAAISVPPPVAEPVAAACTACGGRGTLLTVSGGVQGVFTLKRCAECGGRGMVAPQKHHLPPSVVRLLDEAFPDEGANAKSAPLPCHKCGGKLTAMKKDGLPLLSACLTCGWDGPFWADVQAGRSIAVPAAPVDAAQTCSRCLGSKHVVSGAPCPRCVVQAAGWEDYAARWARAAVEG